MGGWLGWWADGWVALEEWKLRLTQPPAGVSLAGAGAELGNTQLIIIPVVLVVLHRVHILLG